MQTLSLSLARFIMFTHFCVVLLFFSSPFLPLKVKFIIIAAGVLTIPVRIYLFKGDCPLTKLERDFRNKGGDTKAKIHKQTFMEAYFKIPDATFTKIENTIIGILLLTIVIEIFYLK